MLANPGRYDNLVGFGRHARVHAIASAARARYRCRPPLPPTSRDTVDGARPNLAAMLRSDNPAANPREISSRSATVNRSSPRRRGNGRTPPQRFNRSRTVDGCRRIALARTFTASPERHRRHTSSTSVGDNAVRTTATTPLLSCTARIHEALR